MDALIEAHLSLPKALAHRHHRLYRTGIDADELESVARLGLVKAARTFRSDEGTAFKTYAFRVIQNLLHNLSDAHHYHRSWCKYCAAILHHPPHTDRHRFEDVEVVSRLLEGANLSPTERQVIHLRTELDLSYDEMVEQYGRNYEHWKAAFNRAIRKLRVVAGAHYG